MDSAFARIPAEEAYRATMRQKASKWPDRASGRIEPVCLPTITPGFRIAPDASVLTIGSCFARHIEFALMERGITVPTLGFRVPGEELMAGTGLPTGILNKYTPFAMLNEIEAVARGEDGRRFLIEAPDGGWWDGQLHSHETVTLERGLRRRARLRDMYARAIADSEVVIVTLGLTEAWWDETEQLYLNDTVPRHFIDRHPGRFMFETMSIERTIDAVTRLVAALQSLNPAQHMLLTVSPVPFLRSFSGQDALQANSYSKASLRVAAEVAARSYDHVDYYPSYESVTLSDRAEAWEDDLVHVRPAIIARNVERMLAAYMDAPVVVSRAAILVLGMHRSGTSALTWLLGELGAKLPTDAIDAHADNARGYFESAGLIKADDQVLRVARSSWFDPRPLDLSRLWPSAIRSRKDRIREAIERGWGDAPLLAIKDPRMCRFVPLVAEVLGEMGLQPRAVLMLRSPAEIARSLASRDGTSPAFAHLLWLRHMIDAERATRGMPRAILSYDAMLDDWRATMATLVPLAGRDRWQPDEAEAARIASFLDPGLRHHRAEAPAPLEEPLAGFVAAIVAGFDRLAAADDEANRRQLDYAYAALDAAAWLEGDIVHEELRHRRMPPAGIEEEAEVGPPPASIQASPVQSFEPSEDADLIRNSGLFDADWYRATYPDVPGDIDPVDHYVRIGAALGYNPNPLFDTGYYARQMARRIAGRSGVRGG